MDSTFSGVGVAQLLDADPRPAFVVALDRPKDSQVYEIVFENAALIRQTTLQTSILKIPHDKSHKPFWDWVTSPASGGRVSQALDDPGNCLAYLGVYWTRSVVLGRWAVMNGNASPPSSEPPRKIRHQSNWERAGGARVQHSEPATTHVADFPKPTQQADSKALSSTPSIFLAETAPRLMLPDFMPDPEPFLHVIQAVDWDSHKLGPINEWPVRLQQVFHQTIPDSRAIAIYWGPEYRAIYNEAFSKFCGSKHPALLGEPVFGIWEHLREPLDQLRNAAPHERPRKIEDESRFFVEMADGSLEETHVKWSLSPITENRQCVGIQHSLIEITSVRLWERRMKMLIDLGDALITARDVKSYWDKIMEELERWGSTYDMPLAFIYSVVDDDDSASSRRGCPKTCKLAGSLGVPEGHPIAPDTLELRDSIEGLAPAFREAVQAQIALHVRTKDGTLPEHLLQGLQWRGFGDACQGAVILPIRPTRDETVMGILFLGLNPRRPYDNDYRQFISLLNQKLTSSLASTVLLEEEARRGRNAAAQAAYDTTMLKQKLEWQTEQANQSIQNFQAVAEFIPVGMSFVDNQGNVTFANDAWYRLTGYPLGRIDQGALLECVIPEDKPKILSAYDDLKHVDEVTFEFRIPREAVRNQSGTVSPGSLIGYDERVGRHILASAKAERDEDGVVVRMLTSLTDVTEHKNTAEEAVRRAQEAQNLKRLAEFATVGMYDISLDGRLLSANNSFWELSGLVKVDLSKVSVEPWQVCVVEEDLPELQESLEKLKAWGRPTSAEVRLKTTWTAKDSSGNTIRSARTVLATFMPIKSSDGVLQSFTGCISDVSLQRWQLEQERRRKEEAIESKRQQENFIDMTSHEMRNPLSAIIHCTDAIIASLSRIEDLDEVTRPMTPTNPNITTQLTQEGSEQQTSQDTEQGNEGSSKREGKKLLRDAIDHAETIETCAQHQKRIVDDILTMSKLDSKLLAVTPCTVNPINIVTDALKMFEVEARRVDIALTSVIHESYKAVQHEFLDLDPSRVKQVLINLLTNALKFTKTGKRREVTINVKGSLEPPSREMTSAEFIPRFKSPADEYEQPALRDRKNPIYILFEVTDTGQGLSEEEKGTLFNKFVQASAKTHVKYGGSGLGLFISRRLTELQNGAIGVSSQQGVGSTFAFYIEAYVPSDECRRDAETAAAAAKVVAGVDGNGSSGSAGESGDDWKRDMRLRDERTHKRLNPGANVRVDGILIVEDNLINQHVTRRGLSGRGYSVDVANHGIEALEKLRRSVGAMSDSFFKSGDAAYDAEASLEASAATSPGQPIPINVVLMDVEMPIQDGLTCTRHLRDLEASGEIFCASGGRIPIIAVTANARPEQVTEAKLAGCDDVLIKPYRMPELIEKMQLVIRRIGGLSPNSPAS